MSTAIEAVQTARSPAENPLAPGSRFLSRTTIARELGQPACFEIGEFQLDLGPGAREAGGRVIHQHMNDNSIYGYEIDRAPTLTLTSTSRKREVFVEPVPDQLGDQRVRFGQHEMVGVGDEVQIGRLAGMTKKIDRLLGRRDRIIGGVQQQ